MLCTDAAVSTFPYLVPCVSPVQLIAKDMRAAPLVCSDSWHLPTSACSCSTSPEPTAASCASPRLRRRRTRCSSWAAASVASSGTAAYADAMMWVHSGHLPQRVTPDAHRATLCLQGGPCGDSCVSEASEGRVSGVNGSTWAADGAGGQQPAGHCRLSALPPGSRCAGRRTVPQASAAAGPAAAVPAARLLLRELDGGRPASQ
jgi:hypothetical protein